MLRAKVTHHHRICTSVFVYRSVCICSWMSITVHYKIVVALLEHKYQETSVQINSQKCCPNKSSGLWLSQMMNDWDCFCESKLVALPSGLLELHYLHIIQHSLHPSLQDTCKWRAAISIIPAIWLMYPCCNDLRVHGEIKILVIYGKKHRINISMLWLSNGENLGNSQV